MSPGSSGSATVTFNTVGRFTVQAHAPDSVPSDPFTVCVHNGNDGNCGTTVPTNQATPPLVTPLAAGPAPAALFARILGIRNGRVYKHAHAPRVLAGAVSFSGSATLRQVRIRLERRVRRRCYAFSGARERFLPLRRCGHASFFSVGGAASFTYLLPAALQRGLYDFDIEALDGTGKVTRPQNGVSHVVFRVI